MATDRRSFLRLFGLSTAIVPAIATGEPETLRVSPAPAQEINPRESWAAPDVWDVSDGFLYSGVEIERNSMESCYHLFYETLICNRGGFDRTNMHQACRLPQPTSFAVKNMGVIFSKNTPAQLAWSIADRYSMRFILGQKIYAERPVSAVSNLGLHSDAVLQKATSLGRSPLESLNIPIIIPPDHTFEVELRGDPLKVHGKVRLWAFIEGMRCRPVM